MANPKTDIKKIRKKLEKVRNDATNKTFMKSLGEFVANLIRKRTRLGYGVDDQGEKKKKLKKLSDGYVNQRKRSRVASATSPKKSNLTNTAEMLDDLEPKKTKKGKTTIGFKSKHSDDKAGWVSKDRPFNNVSSSEMKQIYQFIKDFIVNKKR